METPSRGLPNYTEYPSIRNHRFYSEIDSETKSSNRKLSWQFVHCASRLLAMTSKPPHFGHGLTSGFFHEVKSQVG